MNAERFRFFYQQFNDITEERQ